MIVCFYVRVCRRMHGHPSHSPLGVAASSDRTAAAHSGAAEIAVAPHQMLLSAVVAVSVQLVPADVANVAAAPAALAQAVAVVQAAVCTQHLAVPVRFAGVVVVLGTRAVVALAAAAAPVIAETVAVGLAPAVLPVPLSVHHVPASHAHKHTFKDLNTHMVLLIMCALAVSPASDVLPVPLSVHCVPASHTYIHVFKGQCCLHHTHI